MIQRCFDKSSNFLTQNLCKMSESRLSGGAPQYRLIGKKGLKCWRLTDFSKFLFCLFAVHVYFTQVFLYGSALVWGSKFHKRLPKGLK